MTEKKTIEIIVDDEAEHAWWLYLQSRPKEEKKDAVPQGK